MVLFCSIIRLRRSMLQQNLSKNTKNASPRSGMPEHAKSNRTGVKYATCSSCRSASRSEQRGHRCQESSACRCRTGGTESTRQRTCDLPCQRCGSRRCCRTSTSPQRGWIPCCILRLLWIRGTRVVMPLWQDVNRNLRDCTRLSGREDALRRRRRRRKRVGPQGLEPWTGRL